MKGSRSIGANVALSCRLQKPVNVEAERSPINEGSSNLFSPLRRCDSGLKQYMCCLLYTSDAADERSSVDLGGRRISKKKKKKMRCKDINIEKQNEE